MNPNIKNNIVNSKTDALSVANQIIDAQKYSSHRPELFRYRMSRLHDFEIILHGVTVFLTERASSSHGRTWGIWHKLYVHSGKAPKRFTHLTNQDWEMWEYDSRSQRKRIRAIASMISWFASEYSLEKNHS